MNFAAIVSLAAVMISAAGSTAQADDHNQPLLVKAAVSTASTTGPCLMVSLQNVSSARIIAPLIASAPSEVKVTLSKNGSLVRAEGPISRSATITKFSGLPPMLGPSQSSTYIDAATPSRDKCIPLSRWGYINLTTGDYDLQVGSIFKRVQISGTHYHFRLL